MLVPNDRFVQEVLNMNIGYSTYRLVEEIKDRIKDKRTTQEDVAAIIGCSRKQLNKILNRHSELKLVTALSLCEILEISEQDFCRLTGAF